jgi:hypothetical protein
MRARVRGPKVLPYNSAFAEMALTICMHICAIELINRLFACAQM